MAKSNISIKELAKELAEDTSVKPRREIEELRKQQFEDTFQNAIPVSGKLYANIRISLIGVDNAYQRNEWLNPAHVKRLSDNWNDNLYDAIKVNPHEDQHIFVVVDGDHRIEAAKQRGKTHILCEILKGISQDEEQRLREEAMLFSRQDMHIHKVTQQQKHKANVIIGKNENVILDKLMNKYGFAYKHNPQDYQKVGYLSGFTASLSAAKVGEQHLNDIFYVIKEGRWNMVSYGLSATVIRSLDMLFKLHPDKRSILKKGLIKYLRTTNPKNIEAMGNVKYPKRNRNEQFTLIIEDKMHELIGLPLEYLKDETTIKRMSNAA